MGKNGTHWMLGVIAFQPKEIIIFDSIRADRTHQFRALTLIAEASYAAAEKPFDISEWKHIYAKDAPSQKNQIDCGVHVCLSAYSILSRTDFQLRRTLNDSALIRRWALNVLTHIVQPKGATDLVVPGNFDNRITLTDDDKQLPNQQIPKHRTTILPVQDICLPTVIGLIERGRGSATSHDGWSHCAASNCEGDHPDFSDVRQAMCVMCRNWYHEKCVSNYVRQTYFTCHRCY